MTKVRGLAIAQRECAICGVTALCDTVEHVEYCTV